MFFGLKTILYFLVLTFYNRMNMVIWLFKKNGKKEEEEFAFVSTLIPVVCSY
jgi:hypothetical protein